MYARNSYFAPADDCDAGKIETSAVEKQSGKKKISILCMQGIHTWLLQMIVMLGRLKPIISPEQSKAQQGTGAGVDDGTRGDLKKNTFISILDV